MTSAIRATRDAYIGLENPTEGEWSTWHRAMLDVRASARKEAGIDLALYDDPDTAWSDTSFRQLFLFMYDASFYDRDARRYRTTEQIDRWMQMFGRVDSVLLWHAYPRLGFDSRNQFDFYRTMPGGIAKLREEVIAPLHARDIRVFVDYNPWDRGPSDTSTSHFDELSEIVAELDADGVMLDTMTDAPETLARAVCAKRRGVIFAPELVPADRDLGRFRQSWAQWLDIGDSTVPSIYRQQWLAPRHRLLGIRRWDTSRRRDIVYTFFNGSGLILWDNVFGTWNPYSRDDRRLIAETGAIFDAYGDLFAHAEWLPLIPTGVAGLDANRWNGTRDGDARVLITLRSRAKEPLSYRVPFEAPAGMTWLAFWGAAHEVVTGDSVVIEPEGTQALVLDEAHSARSALAHFQELSKRADISLPGYDERCPPPRRLTPRDEAPGNVEQPAARTVPEHTRTVRMIEIPAGSFEMKIRHERRECGCYPEGATDDAVWGWFYKDIVVHEQRVEIARFAMREAPVTNAEFVEFVRRSGYRPTDEQRFLEHLPRNDDGSLSRDLSASQAELPVTFVSLDDARAYAEWVGQRLPTEIEWQWAAEGAGAGHRYPWGNDERQFSPELRPAVDPANATPQGVMGMSGNAWELTESEHSDGHTRFVMLRGGVFLPPGESEWLPARGPRPNDSHAKYVLLADGLDRSETVSFRTVVDLS